MKKTIHVAFCIDNTFAIHLAALIHSLGKHLSQNFQLKCHILGSLNEDNIFKLSALVSQYIDISFYDDFPDYKEIPISNLYNNRLNEVTYYRFAIPEVLHNVEKVLFIDADMIAMGDISLLWSIDMMDSIVAVVSDHILGCDKEKQQVRGISSGRYFNAGFMLMDLGKWRKNNISQQALKLLVDNNGFEHNIHAKVFPDHRNVPEQVRAYPFSQGDWVEHSTSHRDKEPYSAKQYLRHPDHCAQNHYYRQAVSMPAD